MNGIAVRIAPVQREELVVVVRRVRGLGFRAALPAGEVVEARNITELHERVRQAIDPAFLRAEGVTALRLEFTVRRRDGLPVCWRTDVLALD